MGTQSEIYDAMYAAMPEARCLVKIGRVEIGGLCAGWNISRESTERGQFGAVETSVWCKAADEPQGEIAIGTVIEVKLADRTEWMPARVGGRRITGGATELVLEAVHA
jgi:hypothetical protein